MKHQMHMGEGISVKRGKHGVKKVIFGRSTIVLFSIFLQFLVILSAINFLAKYLYVFLGGYFAFGVVILLLIINRTENPGIQLSLASVVLLFPLFGGLMYLYLELQPGTHMLRAMLQETDKKTYGKLKQNPETMEKLQKENPSAAQMAYYIYKEEGFPISQNTKATYFQSGEKKFDELLIQLEKARSFIFIEYFIVHPGYMWDSIHEILRRKVKEGVEVRFLYDGMNELYHVPSDFSTTLRGEGIKCKVFSKVYPIISTHYNNRDHRKIVVIDGNTAFTGGVNISDEYINRKERFGHWKDAAIMIQGDAVKNFTLIFLKMWNVGTSMENMAIYLKAEMPRLQQKEKTQVPDRREELGSEGYILPYAADPFHKERTAERIYLHILNHAKQYVHIMTPYLVPDDEMLQALIYAANRGVDVKLMMPHIPDKKYAFALAHSYYLRMIRAGVKIYEYTPGFVHSKVMVSDDLQAVVGTINLDYRSLYLNFESAVYLYQEEEIKKIEQDFSQTLLLCQLITEFDVRHDRIMRKLTGTVLKLIAPLM